jgi:hypothetical protein
VLSNRADLISGGSVLVEVDPPAGTPLSALQVSLNGQDVSKLFGTSASGQFMGLVTGLAKGNNTLSATAPGLNSVSITIVNHPQGGPVIAGPQLQPWTCLNTGATDAQCNQPVSYSYVYKSTSPTESTFQAYDPSNPPSDVATTTTDQGITVPFIVRVETGYQDRDQYQIAALYQPGQPWTALNPQQQFNHKLLITHGASCGVDYQNSTAPSVTSFNPLSDVTSALGAVPLIGDSAQYALGKGFIVMSTALDNSGHNCNVALQAESLIMSKQHLIESYGTLRYTIGTGCSGGSLAEQQIANAYPGVYQGLLPTCSFPDAWSTATQFADYHLLLAYFTNPSNWGSGVVWTPAQMNDVLGGDVDGLINAEVSDNAQFHVAVATDACSGVSDAQRYNPQTNPGGVRCDIQDAIINVFGPRPEDLWSTQETEAGHGFAGFPIDNVGVQYGLSSLQNGIITPTMFLDMNTKVGGLDQDTNPISQRTPAVQPTLAYAYRSGAINETNNLGTVAIIDCRGPNPGLFHDAYRAFAVRARLDRELGGHGNQFIWEGPAPIIGDANCSENSLIAMDQWLATVEQDSSSATLAQKIQNDTPEGVTDECWSGVGVMLSNSLCGDAIVLVEGTPRTVAGDDISTDANKCQLKPLDPSDYGAIESLLFTSAQLSQLQALYADGVCDFSKPGVSQQPTIPWQTYQDAQGNVIYGGQALPAPPANSGGGWASPVFQVFASSAGG